MNLIQTTDFFYALVDDPYTMGRITCCNVLSDMYSMGVTNIDNMLLLLGVPTTMKPDERMVVNKLILEGFRDCAAEAGTLIRGGQTVQNPWLLIGGVATSVVASSQFIMPNQIKPGDTIILTKALGTQVAVNCHQWMLDNSLIWTEKLQPAKVAESQVLSIYERATRQMADLNLTAATLMHEFNAHGCTDVTGFGLIGHARNLVKVQKANVSFKIDRVPILKGTRNLCSILQDRFGLLKGISPETSGGLLLALPAENAEKYCHKFESQTGRQAWIIGSVIESSSREVFFADDVDFFEV